MSRPLATREAGAGRRRGPELDVAVVGGGMVGAAAALALARAGFASALIEAREPAPWRSEDEVDLRVVGLAPSSIGLLDDLGVWTAIRQARVGPYAHMHVWDAGSGAGIDFDAAANGQSELGCIVENSLVQSMLWQALDAAGVRRHCPAAVAGFEVREDRVQLALADGATLAARLLIAADGAGSPLRAMAGIGTRGRDYHQRGVVAHVRTERGHANTAWQRFLPTGPLALLPLADGRCSIVWSLPEAQAARVLDLHEAAFCEAVGVASDFRLGRVTATSERAAFPLQLQLAERYDAERFVLLGDAAHAVHPLAGQGVNLGLRDVFELRDTLVAARAGGRDIAAPHVLRRYARRRRSANTLDALGFDALARIYAWQAPPLVAMRGLGVRLLDRLDPLKQLVGGHAAGR
ncbi:UbiH/UbiF/VisC/COQ6 family ubiquinone biosynthesis hydroxylase [Dyella sp.]|jgi:2-octaprenyl-3-methyl-6-methoxy-1,4-benzoquinol hydroxylase/2-octaprenylphenol hydroxylase|uniref:UbiH/UbiF/VisC/COQ6 family ubiquinone biosynthesis hydroxylase n=1 Tax=Dyella sp. TaxID=1869338 RepID=UPI002D77EA34|nr:UbiH/UbiF/VisC/COQ6 family ubiquinone biosynthesis hydroxylase [Dyella sp.]HET6433357.1 UbiH/UbiF/VisC/COQ6 family ubiquinone biosynthesis hydroxylase [Dyella sp.]